MNRRTLVTNAAAWMAMILPPVHTAAAAVYSWAAHAGGSFSDGANWSPQAPPGGPGPADQALFNLPGAYAVHFSENAATSLLRVRAGEVVLDLGAFSYSIGSTTTDAIVVGVSSGDMATLRVTTPDSRGGVINCKSITIGAAAGAQGALVLSGPATAINATGTVTAGQFGAGALRIESGAALTSFNGFVGLSAGGSATVAGPGSKWINANILDVTRSLILESGGLVSSDLIDVNAITGAIAGDGLIEGHVNMRGTASPGGAGQAGTLQISGEYEQTNHALATLAIELGGTATGTGYDVLLVDGTATIDKKLVVTLIDDFQPPPGAMFDILVAESVLGTFAQTSLPSPPGDRGTFTVQYLADRVRLIAPGRSLHADLSGDGHVNGIDLAMLLAAWSGPRPYSPCPPQLQADLNHDCRVNGIDLAMLLAAWTA